MTLSNIELNDSTMDLHANYLNADRSKAKDSVMEGDTFVVEQDTTVEDVSMASIIEDTHPEEIQPSVSSLLKHSNEERSTAEAATGKYKQKRQSRTRAGRSLASSTEMEAGQEEILVNLGQKYDDNKEFVREVIEPQEGISIAVGVTGDSLKNKKVPIVQFVLSMPGNSLLWVLQLLNFCKSRLMLQNT